MFFVLDSSLSKHIISKLRDRETNSREFTENIKRIACLLVNEALKDFELKEVSIETPIAPCVTKVLKDTFTIVPILRAGLPMAEAVHWILDQSKIGHIGLYRDPETVKPIEYYLKMPLTIEGSQVIICDPILATGRSISKAVDLIKSKYKVASITILSIIASEEGIKNINTEHPEIKVYVGVVDKELNDHAYIVPGVGDAGDRIFGTK
ncbi:uracil phosphoribosyltransferase [Candidatus Mycoplasma haematobovis]|uniref:Uracil phosphoribosyltransferase n=1 Tax=Candidatus Mycoplasma haematobovis TaxID=432608 RepID=A0A1A9QCF7_9MOLU|nr:uracil phosphoribosyltransferase [Candidatus Mycoplasma haematobovis]OAL10262.1 uracil phosphoribosyltransferase [Candidatus Mycoplasma haematobovis]